MKQSVRLFLFAVIATAIALGQGTKTPSNANTFYLGAAYPVGTNPQAIAVGDFNGDGKMDMVTGNDGNDSISILLGKGNGTFSSPRYFLTDSFPTSIVTADFNGDGKLDLAVGTGLDVEIFLGKGDGTFETGVSYALSTSPQYLAAGDINGDGKIDIVSSQQYSTISLLGNGDGTFQPFTFIIKLAGGPVALADMNGDGNLDVVMANLNSGNLNGNYDVDIFPGDGHGNFGSPWVSPYIVANLLPGTLVIADFNGDGKSDIALGGNSTSGNQIVVSFGDGKGHIGPFHLYTTGVSPGRLAAGDLNHPGVPDLVVANAQDEDFTVLLNNGKGFFSNAGNYTTGGGSQLPVAIADFNGDGKPDVVVANPNKNDVVVLLGAGGGRFNDARDSRVGLSTDYLVVADFNHDGKQDVVVGEDSQGLTISLGNGNGTFKPATFISTTAYFGPTIAADVNGDGFLDLVTYPIVASNSVEIYINNGNGTFQSPVSAFCGFPDIFPGDLVSGDFNGDGKVDIAVSTKGFISILLGNGDGTFQSPMPFVAGGQPQGLVVGDFNGDGKLDIAASDSVNQDLAVIFGNGDGTFSEPEIIPLPNQNTFTVAAGYFHGQGEGKLDLIAIAPDQAGSSLNVFINKGNGTFRPPVMYSVGGLENGTIQVAVADFNLDGNPDIALTAAGSNATVLFGNGKGAFTQSTFGWGGGLFGGAAVGDFNGDKKPDLAVTDTTESFTTLLNQTK